LTVVTVVTEIDRELRENRQTARRQFDAQDRLPEAEKLERQKQAHSSFWNGGKMVGQQHMSQVTHERHRDNAREMECYFDTSRSFTIKTQDISSPIFKTDRSAPVPKQEPLLHKSSPLLII
jgi:hypothetical protein